MTKQRLEEMSESLDDLTKVDPGDSFCSYVNMTKLETDFKWLIEQAETLSALDETVSKATDNKLIPEELSGITSYKSKSGEIKPCKHYDGFTIFHVNRIIEKVLDGESHI